MVIVPLFASFVTTLFGLALALTAVFLILLVLVQRGRGGGLAGALGGMGGSSAFGAKAGDIFTRITIGAASVWILLCIVAAKYSTPTSSRIDINVDKTANSQTDHSTTPPLNSGPLNSGPLNSGTLEKETATASDAQPAVPGTVETENGSKQVIPPSADGASGNTEDPSQPPPVKQSPASPE